MLQSNQNAPADFADEKEKGPATLGNSLAELSKVRHTFTIGSDCPIPGLLEKAKLKATAEVCTQTADLVIKS